MDLKQGIELGLAVTGAYGACGVLFAAALHGFGLGRLDPSARGAGIGFRILVTPGMVLLWPFLAVQWRAAIRGVPPPDHTERPVSPRATRTLHRMIWPALAVLVPIGMAAALWFRQDPSAPAKAPAPAPVAPNR